MKLGLQLYSVRDEAEKDLPGVLGTVAKMGYQGVEFAGFFGHDLGQLRHHLDALGLVAIGTHTRYPDIGLGYAAAGPCTRMYFYETAAVNLCCVASGYAGVQTAHPAKAVIVDGVTPLEALFNVEMAYASTGMKTEQANELVNQLLAKYEHEIDKAPAGKRYQECYDLATGKPSEEYVRLYDAVK